MMEYFNKDKREALTSTTLKNYVNLKRERDFYRELAIVGAMMAEEWSTAEGWWFDSLQDEKETYLHQRHQEDISRIMYDFEEQLRGKND